MCPLHPLPPQVLLPPGIKGHLLFVEPANPGCLHVCSVQPWSMVTELKRTSAVAFWGYIFTWSTRQGPFKACSLLSRQPCCREGDFRRGHSSCAPRLVLWLSSSFCSPVPRGICSHVWFCSPGSGFIASRSLCVCSLNERRLGEPALHFPSPSPAAHGAPSALGLRLLSCLAGARTCSGGTSVWGDVLCDMSRCPVTC